MSDDTTATAEITVSCYNFEGLTITGLPTSIEQFDSMAGRVGAALDAAIDNYIAHTHLTRVRKLLCEKLEASTGIARKRDGKKFAETESSYIKRLESELGEELFTNHRAAAEEAFAETPVNLARIVRVGGGATASIAKKYMEAATGLLQAGKVPAFLAKYLPTVAIEDLVSGGNWVDEDAQRQVAAKIKEISLEAERAAREAAAAKLAAL